MSQPIAIVPVKGLAEAKSRLSDVLDASERIVLVVGMLRTVVAALAESRAVAHVVVVSPDPVVLSIAREIGAGARRQAGTGLNEALSQARASLAPGSACLAISADLPLVSAGEVRACVAAHQGVAVVIAPDRDAAGTNALLLAPDTAFAYSFGAGSFERHKAACIQAGLSHTIFRSPGTEHDVDVPRDLAALASHAWPSEALGIPAGAAFGSAR